MFVRGGYVVPGNRLYFAGNYGNYWSSDGYNSNYADYLDFSSGYVVPSSNFLYRYHGFFVRCVALGG